MKFRKPNPLQIRYKGQTLKLRTEQIDLKEALRVGKWITKVILYKANKN